MNHAIAARALHVIGVVLWIGGVAFVTTAAMPAIRATNASAERLAAFHRVSSGRRGSGSCSRGRDRQYRIDPRPHRLRNVRRLARPREVRNDTVSPCPQVEIPGDEFRPLIHAEADIQRRRQLPWRPNSTPKWRGQVRRRTSGRSAQDAACELRSQSWSHAGWDRQW